jgi:hypothetical protein
MFIGYSSVSNGKMDLFRQFFRRMKAGGLQLCITDPQSSDKGIQYIFREKSSEEY